MTATPPATRGDWRALSETISASSQLRLSRTPTVATRGTHSRHETEKEFQIRAKETKARDIKERRELHELHGVKSPEELEQKIEELEAEKKRLWVVCRPDLYGPGAPCEHEL